jgi:hypothetical protein
MSYKKSYTILYMILVFDIVYDMKQFRIQHSIWYAVHFILRHVSSQPRVAGKSLSHIKTSKILYGATILHVRIVYDIVCVYRMHTSYLISYTICMTPVDFGPETMAVDVEGIVPPSHLGSSVEQVTFPLDASEKSLKRHHFILYPRDSSMAMYANSMTHLTRFRGYLEVEIFGHAVMCSGEHYFKIGHRISCRHMFVM